MKKNPDSDAAGRAAARGPFDVRATPARAMYDRLRLPEQRPRISRLLPTPWPKVGGAELEMRATSSFQSPAWLDVFARGEGREIYIGACPGLGTLSKQIHMPTYKASTCAERGLKRRMAQLRRDETGAFRFYKGQYVRDAGWSAWFPSHIYPLHGPSLGSPVTVRERSLHVCLPANLASDAFDKAFDLEVRKGALDLWAMTEAGRNHCAFLNVDGAYLQRFTQYPDWAMMPVIEIVGLSIYSGADRLIRIAEKVLLDHAGLEWTIAR